jgi:hypothetical protein
MQTAFTEKLLNRKNFFLRHLFLGALLLGLAFLLLNIGTSGHAAAPLRSGQPYAEATKCAESDVIFCEDFNYPQNFYCGPTVDRNNHRWINPGWAQESVDFAYCGGRQINPASSYPTQPSGSPSGGYVWVSNWDSSKGQVGNGSSSGKLRRPGGNYVNGLPPVRDFYVRFQVYWTSNWAWPGDPRTDKYNLGAYPCVDNKILFIYPPEGLDNPTNASYDAGPLTGCGAAYDPISNARFGDALTFRVGTSSDNYKSFPMDVDAGSNPQHMEYAPYQSLILRNPNDQPLLGRIFRFNTNRWYTLEFRYKLGTSGQKNGVIEAWIDGKKIYTASDLETCTSSSPYGDCSGLGALILVAYHNSMDVTKWNGQQVIDNLIISRSYIGSPAGSSTVDATPPAAPTNLTVTAP